MDSLSTVPGMESMTVAVPGEFHKGLYKHNQNPRTIPGDSSIVRTHQSFGRDIWPLCGAMYGDSIAFD